MTILKSYMQLSLNRLLALTGSGPEGNKIAHVNFAPATGRFAFGGSALFQHEHDQRKGDNRAKDQNGTHLFTHSCLLSTLSDTATYRAGPSRKFVPARQTRAYVTLTGARPC